MEIFTFLFTSAKVLISMVLIIDAISSVYKYLTGTQNEEANTSTEHSPESLKPYTIFPLTDESSSTFTLNDGRKLGYAQYGDLNGKPIFFFHGTPGSRIDGAFLHDKASKAGARIICIDRPGIGWSSPNPEGKVLDHVRDVERLAEFLGLEEYAVLVRSFRIVWKGIC